jgi:hypothetical protein
VPEPVDAGRGQRQPEAEIDPDRVPGRAAMAHLEEGRVLGERRSGWPA